MQPAPIPANEAPRVAALRRLGLLDTPPEERFDRYTRVACRVFGVPIALVSLVDSDRQWFKSRQGIDAPETPREISFCGHAVAGDDLLIVSDTLADARFADNPLVAADPGIRFYAGCPVHSADGHAIGTLCLIDREPHVLSEADIALLRDMAKMVEQEFNAQSVASTDELTGLSNRRGLRGVAPHALAMCERLGVPATVLFFDLDGFKQINDTFGHGEGDRALRLFANMLGVTFREADIAARIGGDEFVVLCSGADVTSVETPLARLDAALDGAISAARLPYAIRYSVGMVAYDRETCANVESMLAVADRRMYEAKRGGRPRMPIGTSSASGGQPPR